MGVLALCLVIFTFICMKGLVSTKDAQFQVIVNGDGTYALAVDGVTWLPGGPTWFRSDGKKYSNEDGSLKLTGYHNQEGRGPSGVWNRTTFLYEAGSMMVQANILTYVEPALPFVIFSQVYLSGATNTSDVDADGLISSFPSFDMNPEKPAELGYVAYGNDMSGWVSLSLGRWTAAQANFSTGIQGGPIIIFDDKTSAIVLSPLSKFMAASNQRLGDSKISWGIMGLVDSVYSGYSIDFIAYFSDNGVNEAMRGWGDYLTTSYSKTGEFRDKDLLLTHLGYWTDNGAYYYFYTEEGKDYETTMLDVTSQIKQLGLPIKYLQIDMWFYPVGHVQGTKTWTPDKDVFPHGFDGLYNKTGLPIALHNKYWDNETTYAAYNGGDYNFISDQTSGYALPDDQQFWIDLLVNTTNQGHMIMYEQDFMNIQNDRFALLLSDLDLGSRWLHQIGQGAEEADVTIQYCMAYARHLLQSLEIPRVTQVRVSDDYHAGNQNWKIGVTSMFADAVGLAPSKDNFWTTSVEPGNKYNLTETFPHVQALVATLSTGPVGSGDGIGDFNTSLLMKCCDSDGKILRASRPLTMMDKAINLAAFSGINPNGSGEVLYSTVSKISGQTFGIILAKDLVGDYVLQPDDLEPDYSSTVSYQDLLTYIYSSEPDQSGSYTFLEWSSDSPIEVDRNTCGDSPCILYSIPTFGDGSGKRIGLLGELGSKFSPVSPQRFSDLHFNETGRLEVKATLNPGELVDVWFLSKDVGSLIPFKGRCDNTQGHSKVQAVVWADWNQKFECQLSP